MVVFPKTAGQAIDGCPGRLSLQPIGTRSPLLEGMGAADCWSALSIGTSREVPVVFVNLPR